MPTDTTGAVAGSVAYLPPERLAAHQAVPAGDVFSLGCVLAFAATGHGPFDTEAADAADAATGPATRQGTHEAPDLDGLTGDLRNLIGACLAAIPADRPDLRRLQAELPATAFPAGTWDVVGPTGAPRPVPSTSPRIERRTLLIGALVAGGAVVTAGAAAVAAVVLRPGGAAEPTPRHSGAAGGTPSILPGDVASWSTVVFSPDGRTVAANNYRNDVGFVVQLWDVSTGRPTGTLATRGLSTHAVAFSPDGRTLAAGGQGIIQLWDVAAGRGTATLGERGGSGGPVEMITELAFVPDGKTVVNGGTQARLRDVATGRATATLVPTGGQAYSAALSQDGRLLATGGGGTIELWDMATRAHTATLTGRATPGSTGPAVAFSPDARTVVGGGIGIDVWDVAARRRIGTYPGRTPVTFAPSGNRFASRDDVKAGGASALWDVATGRRVASYPGTGPLAISPDGRTLACLTEDARHVQLQRIR